MSDKPLSNSDLDEIVVRVVDQARVATTESRVNRSLLAGLLAEWLAATNRERADLIRRKLRGDVANGVCIGLSADELKRLEVLQDLGLRTLDAIHPIGGPGRVFDEVELSPTEAAVFERLSAEAGAADTPPEWTRLNQRRAELIHKKNRGGLTAAEAAEYAALQQAARLYVESASPPKELLADELEARLAARGVEVPVAPVSAAFDEVELSPANAEALRRALAEAEARDRE